MIPIKEAISVLREEHKARANGYYTHIVHGGSGDPAEEVSLDALELAIKALEWMEQQEDDLK